MQGFLDKFGISLPTAVWSVAAIALVLLAWFVARLIFSGKVRSTDGARNRQPRLGVVVAYDLDRQRQLVLVRRDNVEHLLMIGGPNDVVVESAIVRAGTEARPRQTPADEPVASGAGTLSIPLPPPAPQAYHASPNMAAQPMPAPPILQPVAPQPARDVSMQSAAFAPSVRAPAPVEAGNNGLNRSPDASANAASEPKLRAEPAAGTKLRNEPPVRNPSSMSGSAAAPVENSKTIQVSAQPLPMPPPTPQPPAPPAPAVTSGGEVQRSAAPASLEPSKPAWIPPPLVVPPHPAAEGAKPEAAAKFEFPKFEPSRFQAGAPAVEKSGAMATSVMDRPEPTKSFAAPQPFKAESAPPDSLKAEPIKPEPLKPNFKQTAPAKPLAGIAAEPVKAALETNSAHALPVAPPMPPAFADEDPLAALEEEMAKLLGREASPKG